MVRRSNGSAQIVLLDHGLYETIPEDVRINICHIYKATVMGGHVNMKKYSDYLGMPGKVVFSVQFGGFILIFHMTPFLFFQ